MKWLIIFFSKQGWLPSRVRTWVCLKAWDIWQRDARRIGFIDRMRPSTCRWMLNQMNTGHLRWAREYVIALTIRAFDPIKAEMLENRKREKRILDASLFLTSEYTRDYWREHGLNEKLDD